MMQSGTEASVANIRSPVQADHPYDARAWLQGARCLPRWFLTRLSRRIVGPPDDLQPLRIIQLAQRQLRRAERGRVHLRLLDRPRVLLVRLVPHPIARQRFVREL